MSSEVTVERVGRRSYFRGNTFPIKDAIKSAGGHWDADERAWWIGDDAKARELVSTAKPAAEATGTFRRLPDDSWGVRGRNLVAGKKVTVLKADRSRVERVVKSILSTDSEGWQTATLEPESRSGSYSGFQPAGGRGRGTPTGCRCGSVEEFEKSTDCWSCRHDRD